MSASAFVRLSKVTLGTVQIGMPYGRVVPTVPPNRAACFAILDRAVQGGMTCIDTAPAYGNAENVVGDWLTAGDKRGAVERPLIVTKMAALETPEPSITVSAIRQQAQGSIARLGIDRIDGYLVHRARDLFHPGIAEALRELVDEETIGAFGVSVYDAAELASALEIPGLSLVQLPFSLLDRRMAQAGMMERCVECGVTVFARSVYLQGVVFLAPDRLPVALHPLGDPLARLRAIAKDSGLSIAALCLRGVLAEPGIASVVVGAARPAELELTLEAAGGTIDDGLLVEARAVAKGIEPSILDPRRWG